MSDKNDSVASAIMANNVAWSSLLAVLVHQGAVDIHTVGNELLHVQKRYREAGLDSVADALDWHTDAIEGIRSDE